MKGDDFFWAEPADPPKPRHKVASASVWFSRLEPLLEHPGRWARFSDAFTFAIITRLRGGSIAIPPGRWEFAGRAVSTASNECFIFARYLGPAAEDV